MAASNLIQFFTNAALFASQIFIPIMARELGADDLSVGLIVGVFNLAYFLSAYLFGILTDLKGARRILIGGLLLSAVLFAAQVLAGNLAALFWVRALAGLAAGIFPVALTVYAFHERAGLMGRFTAYGSLGWAFGSLLAGLLIFYGPIFAVSALLFFVSFAIACRFPEIRSGLKVGFLPLALWRKNARIYIPYFLRALGAQTAWSLFPLYLMGIGADKFLVAAAYFVNCFAQFFFMQYLERFRNLYLFYVGLLTSVLSFIGYAVIHNIWLIFPVQLLLAYSFSALQVGANQEILRNNQERGSAVGILNAEINFTAVLGPCLAGLILCHWGFDWVMWFAAGVTFLGLVSFTYVLE
ncbi:MAG: MFS transporter [Candidatus Saganbacteria bacterium]|nr:MFS transporter [Candidatus Saganbacteria bacterium]